jgi:SPP1 gp7 family putative phage head morphogenesis protein
MKNADYWKKRFEILEDSQNRNAARTVSKLEQQFNLAQRTVDDQINAWYGRFADNNAISLAEAKKWLAGKELAEFKWDVNEYIKHGKEAMLDPSYVKQLENASARFHVSKLEALKIQTQNTMERLYGNQADMLDSLMKKNYLDGYYHSAFELQKGVGVGWDIAGIDEKQLEKILSKPWTLDGSTFSDRIWTQKQKLVDEVHTQLTQNMILGKAPDDAIKAIAKKFNTSKVNAGRVVMTESAYFSNLAQKDAYNTLDVEMIEILGTLDSRTCALCGSFDGTTLKTSEFDAGITTPPYHVMCRCTTVPYFDDDDGERIARNAEGENYNVPQDMKYEDWLKKQNDNLLSTVKGASGTIKADNSKKDAEFMHRPSERDLPGFTPMPENQFNRMVNAFTAKGGVIERNAEWDRYLYEKGYAALTYNAETIVFPSSHIPSRATVFEELIHSNQYRKGENDGTPISRLKCEIAAADKLIKHAKAYRLTQVEIERTVKNREAYLEDLENLFGREG